MRSECVFYKWNYGYVYVCALCVKVFKRIEFSSLVSVWIQVFVIYLLLKRLFYSPINHSCHIRIFSDTLVSISLVLLLPTTSSSSSSFFVSICQSDFHTSRWPIQKITLDIIFSFALFCLWFHYYVKHLRNWATSNS